MNEADGSEGEEHEYESKRPRSMRKHPARSANPNPQPRALIFSACGRDSTPEIGHVHGSNAADRVFSERFLINQV